MKNSMWAIIMAVGIALCGYFIYLGIFKYAEKDRCVTVKGLSEREVLANRVTWPIKIEIEGNDINQMYEQISQKQDSLLTYLKKNTISDSEITISSPDMTDRWEYNYDECIKKGKKRYTLSMVITVVSKDVNRIISLMNKELELRKKGLDISTNEYGVEYEYINLSDLKPEMVEEATKNARDVAEKFAKDAECSLGGIINASQGQFTIEDQYTRPQYKKIRVVTTIAYYLR